jgi:hypothetical protein
LPSGSISQTVEPIGESQPPVNPPCGAKALLAARSDEPCVIVDVPLIMY